MRRIAWSVLDGALVMGIAAGSCACSEPRGGPGPVEPTAPPAEMAPAETSVPVCERARDRPAAGEAAVEDRPHGSEVLVRYSATPRDAPCETLDVVVRLRGEMLLGEPGSQVELVWSTEGAIDDGVAMSLLLGSATVPLASELKRSGSRAELIARAPAAVLARYGSERRPTLVISDRKIELSERQAGHLRRFLRRLPAHVLRSPEAGDRQRDEPRARVEADPASGQGWLCVETSGTSRKERTSSCHRTAAECEESRAAFRAAGSQVGDCDRTQSAVCYSWRAGASSSRACFYRPSHCARDETRREDDSAVKTTGCRPAD